jgi:hypothetical protein
MKHGVGLYVQLDPAKYREYMEGKLNKDPNSPLIHSKEYLLGILERSFGTLEMIKEIIQEKINQDDELAKESNSENR